MIAGLPNQVVSLGNCGRDEQEESASFEQGQIGRGLFRVAAPPR
jgi:hypothetical protein